MQLIRNHRPRNRLGHRGAAGVAGTDEQDRRAQQPLDDSLVVDARANDFVAVALHAQDGRGSGEARGTGVEHEVDVLVIGGFSG